MPKLQISATELVSTDVARVSLVKRGANRIPFRIVKEDNETMFDLGKIGRQLFKKDTGPVVVGVVLTKGADEAAVNAALAAAGLDAATLTKSEDGEIVTLAKADVKVSEDETSVLKCSDDVALVVTGLKKSFCSYNSESNSFLEVLKQASFYPSMSMASSALTDTVYNIMWSSESPADAATKISKAVDEFKGYVTTLANGLPVQAFKADVELAKSDMGKKTKAKGKAMETEPDGDEAGKMKKSTNGTGDGFEEGKGTGTNPKATADDAANSITNKQHAQKEGEAAEVEKSMQSDGTGKGFAASPDDSQRANTGDEDKNASITNKQKDKAQKEDGDADLEKGDASKQKLPEDKSGAGAAEEAKKSEDPVMAAIAALSKSLTDGLAAMNTRVDQVVETIKADVEKVSGEVGRVAELARKTDEALTGTVLGDAGEDKTGLRKSEGTDASIPLLDTAFMKRDAA